ncbi:biglycan-like [Antedon mediterranea]|uniref:biglycan-like n=1 Tax=Antedon mediterranea TaxID=105859 RepID=UPI003AF42107
MFLRYLFTFLFSCSYVIFALADCMNNASGEDFVCTCESPNRYWLIVNCSRRGLVHLPAGIPENTTHLRLDNNNLTKIASDALLRFFQLKEISLDFNKLTELPKFPKYINRISANYNYLKSIDGVFSNLTRLDRIMLNGNPIKKLTKTSFQGAHFRRIDVCDSALEQIEPFTFAGLQSINEIHLQKIQIKGLMENAFFFRSKGMIEM